MASANDRKRTRTGQYMSDDVIAERDAEILRLYREDGLKFEQIADRLNCSLATVYRRYNKAIRDIVREPAQEVVDQIIADLATERGRLEDIRKDIVADLGNPPPMTTKAGDIVFGRNGDVVPDPDALYKIRTQLMQIDAQLRANNSELARLCGLNEPAKTQITGEVRYEIIGVDPADLK